MVQFRTTLRTSSRILLRNSHLIRNRRTDRCGSRLTTASLRKTTRSLRGRLHQLRGVRLRDGAVRWGIYRDAIDPEHLNETFVMESWLDYLRSRERITAADELIRARVRALHQGDELPKTSYQIYAREIADSVS